MTFIADRPKHGIRTTYETHKCRCVECVAWRREYRQSCKGTPCYKCKVEPRNAGGICNTCARRQARVNYKSEVRHAWFIKRTYGITIDEYNAMLEEQGGVCAICKGTNADERKLSVDHDHATGAVRGLLCSVCNFALGQFKDDVTLLAKAIQYLEAK